MENNTKKPHVCLLCCEAPAKVRISVTDLEGILLDTMSVCINCFNRHVLNLGLVIGDIKD